LDECEDAPTFTEFDGLCEKCDGTNGQDGVDKSLLDMSGDNLQKLNSNDKCKDKCSYSPACYASMYINNICEHYTQPLQLKGDSNPSVKCYVKDCKECLCENNKVLVDSKMVNAKLDSSQDFLFVITINTV